MKKRPRKLTKKKDFWYFSQKRIAWETIWIISLFLLANVASPLYSLRFQILIHVHTYCISSRSMSCNGLNSIDSLRHMGLSLRYSLKLSTSNYSCLDTRRHSQPEYLWLLTTIHAPFFSPSIGRVFRRDEWTREMITIGWWCSVLESRETSGEKPRRPSKSRNGEKWAHLNFTCWNLLFSFVFSFSSCSLFVVCFLFCFCFCRWVRLLFGQDI